MRSYSREINFNGINNFRDLGGYRAKGNRTVVWRRLFRSGYLHSMTEHDLNRLKEEIRLTAVIDLRSDREPQQLKEKNLLTGAGIKYFNVPFIGYSKEELQHDFKHMGEVYMFRIRHEEYTKRIIEAMEIIAQPANHPLLFHCGAGKDRAGVIAALVLNILGVADVDIIRDYVMSKPYMENLITRVMNEPETPEEIKNLPAYTWEATSTAMAWFLNSLEREFGSVRKYLEIYGAEASLFDRLEKVLLI